MMHLHQELMRGREAELHEQAAQWRRTQRLLAVKRWERRAERAAARARLARALL